MSGWGLVDGKTRATQLQAVQVEVLPDKECTNRFSHQISILPKSYGWALRGCVSKEIKIQKDEMVSRSVALKATRIWYVVSK